MRVRAEGVLVLGAGGLVGSALLRAGAERGLTHAELDITDLAAVEAAFVALRPAAVINAAAQAKVDLAETDPETARQVNGLAPGALARLSRKVGIPRFVHLSTDYVLDSAAPGRLNVDTPPNPRSAYAKSKRLGEANVLEARGTVVRIQWVYHPTHPGFFSRTLDALARGETVRLVTDQVGSPTPVDLLAPALLAAARGGPTGLYHLACGGEARPWDWIAAAAELRGLPFRAVPVTRAELGGAHRPARSCLDSRRFETDWGIRLPDWREGLALVLA